MHSGPSKIAEAVVAVFVPPACREEVLGDLHERFRSPSQYSADALRAIPLVVISRMRRTADAQILAIQAFALYMSYLGAAWFEDRAVLREQWGLLRLAIPAAMALFGLILDDTYANPGRRSALSLARGPLLGLGIALAFQGLFWIGDPDLAVPRWIAVYGCGMSLLLSSAVRMLFPPVTSQLLGANAPGRWLKAAGGPHRNPQRFILVLKDMSAVVAVAIVGIWMGDHSVPPKAATLALLLLIAYRISEKG